MARGSILACLLGVVVLAGTRTAVEASSGELSFPLLYTSAPRYLALAWMHGGDRFPSGARIILRDAQGHTRAMVPEFAASADPAVSFDGKRVLFAGKLKAQDPWQIWEIALGLDSPRRITLSVEDCVRPFYLPDDRVVYARKISGRFLIEVAGLDGHNPLALTYGPSNFLPTDILRDGRILFETGHPVGADAIPEIHTVYADGSGVESYRCDHGSHRYQGRQVSSGDIVFATQHGLARFTSARAHEVPITAPAGEYAGDITETPSGEWLMPWRLNEHAAFRLVLWSPDASRLRPLILDKADNVIQPVVLRESAVPKRHPSGLHDWANANLLCLNAYTSKDRFAPGSIHSVRLYTHDGKETQLLGAAPVEQDGSFFIQVPTERPLQIELLDASGKTLKRESGFFWMRRGEQRVCVGCHAGPEASPENAVPMVLLKSTTPADLTGAHAASGGH